MHEYYQKASGKLKKTMRGFLLLVRQRAELSPYLPKQKSLPSILLSNLLLFTVVFSVLGLVFQNALGLTGYRGLLLFSRARRRPRPV